MDQCLTIGHALVAGIFTWNLFCPSTLASANVSLNQNCRLIGRRTLVVRLAIASETVVLTDVLNFATLDHAHRVPLLVVLANATAVANRSRPHVVEIQPNGRAVSPVVRSWLAESILARFDATLGSARHVLYKIKLLAFAVAPQSRDHAAAPFSIVAKFADSF